MWGACLAEIQGGPFPDWQEKYMELMFDVNDKSGTGHHESFPCNILAHGFILSLKNENFCYKVDIVNTVALNRRFVRVPTIYVLEQK